jgi:hypothetical protein
MDDPCLPVTAPFGFVDARGQKEELTGDKENHTEQVRTMLPTK